MKKFFPVLLVSCAACVWNLPAAPAIRPVDLDSRPARSIQISNQKFAEFQPGTKNLEIVQPEPSLKTLQFAAQELKTFLEKRLQTSIPVRSTPSGKNYAIVLGRCELARKAGIDDSVLCRDAFIIRTAGKNIYILGRDSDEHIPQKWFDRKVKINYWMINENKLFCSERGTLFGVYDFLERFAGIRFYFPSDDFTFIPAGKMTIPVVNIFDRPDFELRSYSYAYGLLKDGVDQKIKQDKTITRSMDRFVDTEKVYHAFRTRMETRTVPKSHGFLFHYLPQRFTQSHPEYLALLDPKGSLTDPRNRSDVFPCLSHGVLDVVKQDIRDYFSGKSKLDGNFSWHHEGFLNRGVNLTLPDAYVPCRCAECRPHFASLQRSSDHIWKFTAEVARTLQQEKIPGYVTMAAYDSYCLPPSAGIPLPENLWVIICTNGPWNMWTLDALEKEFQLIKNWHQKTGRKNWLWNYWLKWGNLNIPDVPNPTPRAVAQFYKLVAPYVNGVFSETYTDNYYYHFMNYYMFGRIAWDNSADIEQILREHYSLLYGKGAGYMQKFFDQLESIWLQKIYKVLPSDSTGPRFAAPPPHELWFNIYGPEKMKELRQNLEQARQAEQNNPQILRRIGFIQRNFYDPLELAGNRFRRMFDLAGSVTFMIEPLAAGETITADGQGDEAVWKRCTPIQAQGFTLPADRRQDTAEVRAAADQKNLYVLFRCAEPDIKAMEDYSGSDANHVEIFLQSSKAPKSVCLQVILNSKGEIFQFHRRYRSKGSITKIKPVPGLTGAVKKMDDAWFAEIKIPLSAIPDFDGNELYGNFCRQQRNKRIRSFYSWVPTKIFYAPDRFGALILPPPIFGGKPVNDVDYNRPEAWPKSRLVQTVDGVLTIQGSSLLTGPKFEVDPKKTYILSLQCSAKELAEGENSLVLAGFQVFDRNGQEIRAVHVHPVSEVLTLAEDLQPGALTVRVKGNVAKLKPSAAFSLVSGAEKDLSDLPNRNIVGSGIAKVEKQKNTTVITFRNPVKTALKAGTPVRFHCAGGYLYAAGFKEIGQDWTMLKGHIRGIEPGWDSKKWPVGTAQARVVLLPNWNRKAKSVQFKDISLTAK